MDFLFIFGRILFGGYFLMSGIQHFKYLTNMIGYAASKKVPAPKIAVMATGLLLLLSGLSVILGVYTFYAFIALAVFLVVTAFVMHDFWRQEDHNMKMMEMHQMLKNMALAGASLMALMISDWPFSL